MKITATVIIAALGVASLARADTPTPRRISISVTEKGFEPHDVTVTKGEPVTFVFVRRTDHTCAKEVIVYLDDGKTVEQKLPLDKPVEIPVTFAKTGELGFACAMKMHAGVIKVQ